MSLTEELKKIDKSEPQSNEVMLNGMLVPQRNNKSIGCQEMTFAYQPKDQIPALYQNSTALINRGEIAVLMASPGVGKTSATEGAGAAFLIAVNKLDAVDTIGFRYISIGKKALLCDTERTADDCSKTYQNIFRRVGKRQELLTEDGSKFKDLTHLVMAEIGDPHVLRKVLESYLSSDEYEFVILDGVLDFSASMLDDKDSVIVVKWLRALAVKYNCAIVVTIHPNKGTTNPAGHIGAFLLRWSRAFLLIRSTSDKNVKEITIDFDHFKLSHASPGDFEPVFFSWDQATGMMKTCGAPAPPMYKLNFLKQAIIELRLNGYHEIPSAILKDHYGKLAGIKTEAAKKHLLKAVDDGLLISHGEGRSTSYLPAADWDLSGTSQSGTYAPYIYKGAIPDSRDEDTRYPNDTRIRDNGYPNEWN